jgi:hypothetical protein
MVAWYSVVGVVKTFGSDLRTGVQTVFTPALLFVEREPCLRKQQQQQPLFALGKLPISLPLSSSDAEIEK